MLKGIGASGGIAIGSALVWKEQSLSYSEPEKTDAAAEKERLEQALASFRQKTEKMAEEMERQHASGDILRSHIMMIDDPVMKEQMNALLDSGKCAEAALSTVCDLFIGAFSQTQDELIQQRAADVRDIKNSILKLLLGVEETDLAHLPSGTILVLEELTPSMTAQLDLPHLAGIVAEKGGKTSHSAILSRSLSIPAVLSVPNATQLVQTGDLLVLDGSEGFLLPNPDEQTRQHYEGLREARREKQVLLQTMRGKPTITADGVEKELFANIGSPEDLSKVLDSDAEGIGLFRTEFLFMDRSSLPDEQEQLAAYRKAAIAMKGKPVVIRTLDIGGDKELPYLGLEKEENPFLGFRAVRYCLQNSDLFKIQLRAILQASHYGNVKMMIPMVTTLTEVRLVRALLEEEKRALRATGIPFQEELPVGVMIETPAACAIADLLAKEVDFFSIGTNDLTQYVMAADRGNAKVAQLYSHYDPAVLRSLERVIRAGKKEGISVGMCGEAAADPLMMPLLLDYGLDEFSVSPNAVLEVRAEMARWSLEQARAVSRRVSELSTAKEIENLLKKER